MDRILKIINERRELIMSQSEFIYQEIRLEELNGIEKEIKDLQLQEKRQLDLLNWQLFNKSVTISESVEHGLLARWENYKGVNEEDTIPVKKYWIMFKNNDKLVVSYSLDQGAQSGLEFYEDVELQKGKLFKDQVLEYWTKNK